MRILYVLNSLGMGGAERQVLALAARMQARGHTVAILVLRPKIPQQWPTSIRVIHLDLHKNLLSLISSLIHARRMISEYEPEIVHSHSFHANIFARVLRVFHPKTILISTVHNVYEGSAPRMLAYRLTDPLAHRSIAAADRFVRLKAVPRNKCLVITNGIDVNEFAASANRRHQMREAQGLTNEFIWISASRLAPAKDIPNLLRAFAKVRDAHPHAQLWIAGAATQASQFETPVSTQVRWLGLRRDLPALLDAADAFVLASAWEGMPLVIGEAMSMEKPVVATDVGGVRELIAEQGSIVSPRNAEALAKAMLDVMQKSQDEREKQGRAARDRVVSLFNLDAKADEWQTLYSSLAPQRG